MELVLVRLAFGEVFEFRFASPVSWDWHREGGGRDVKSERERFSDAKRFGEEPRAVLRIKSGATVSCVVCVVMVVLP